jgi:glycosyltransferase involved in cell wall biosynthesis
MLHYAESLCTASERGGGALVLFGNGGARADLRLRPSRWWFIRKIFQKYNPLFYYFLAQKVHVTLRPRIVHVTSSSPGLGFFIKGLKNRGIKVVHTVHDPEPHEENRSPWSRAMSSMSHHSMRAAIRHSDRVHVHSDLHKISLVEHFGARYATKIYVVQHGAGATSAVLHGGTSVPELGSLGKLDEGLVVLFFGRVEPYKGLAVLYDALSSRKFSRPITLIVAGEGLAPELAVGAGHGFLRINRFIEDSEIKSLFTLAEVVVLPYISATQTGVIPLSYSFGKPVIATNAGALSELVVDQKTGIIVQTADAIALANAIELFAAKPQLSTCLGDQALKHLESHLSWSIVSKLHDEHYLTLLLSSGVSANLH